MFTTLTGQKFDLKLIDFQEQTKFSDSVCKLFHFFFVKFCVHCISTVVILFIYIFFINVDFIALDMCCSCHQMQLYLTLVGL